MTTTATGGNQYIYNDEFMKAAFAEADKALKCGEVAVGCVFVRNNNTIVARGHNLTNARRDATQHAELVAVEGMVPPPTDLSDCVLYVTVEPCIMCAAALRLWSVGHVFYGCPNDRFGGNGSVLDVNSGVYRSEGGHRASEAIDLLKVFYSGENEAAPEERRKRKTSAH
eukprot:PhM_4_TR13985/c0_g1_i1/m.81704/K15441/TAD2, ADAT2; tRNA-specific adenosine deaminase 2